ncbi:MAG TPA: hypothetical protein VKT76_14860 [Bradyrhizobium sp.]|nr:hypothetical protein [Bradyrhizobium sp.]
MPILRYFLFTGGALLALLFAVSAYVPATPTIDISKPTADLSIIRIHSDQKWPERIVFDTTHPTTPPPPHLAAPVVAEAVPPARNVAGPPLKGQVRQAFAQLRPNTDEIRNPVPKRKRRVVTKIHLGPPTVLAAQQPHFGFFGSNIW